MFPRHCALIQPLKTYNIDPSLNRTTEQCSPSNEYSRSCEGDINSAGSRDFASRRRLTVDCEESWLIARVPIAEITLDAKLI